MKDNTEPEPEEYRISYSLEDSVELLTKYFMAVDTEGAKKMFSFVCEKNDFNASLRRVEKWNRWSSEWEIKEETEN
jgi:hypothetical protein